MIRLICRRFRGLLSSAACFAAIAAAAHAGLAVPEGPSVDDNLISFGTTVRLDPKVVDLVVENTGTETVGDLSAVISGTHRRDFEFLGFSATSIPAGSSVTARVRFAPQEDGARVAAMTISSASPTMQDVILDFTATGSIRFTPVITGTGTFTATDYENGTFTLTYFTNGVTNAVRNSGATAENPTPGADGFIAGLFGSYEHQFTPVIAVGPPPTHAVTVTLRKYEGGVVDPTFVPKAPTDGGAVLVQADGKPIVTSRLGSVVRFRANGAVDHSFSATLDSYPPSGFIQPDGRPVIGGYFAKVNGTPRTGGVVRFRADGSLDGTLSLSATTGIERLIPLPDGKMMAFGNFLLEGRRGIVRLNADGSVDETFNTGIERTSNGIMVGAAVQPDGKVLLSGPITVDGVERVLVRFNTDGSRDPTFNPSVGDLVSALAIQKDGKIVIGGHFLSVGGSSRTRIARLNVDGSLDTTFGSGSAPDNAVSCIAIQADGKIVIGGVFHTISGQPRPSSLARVMPDGTLDYAFTPSGSAERVTSIAMAGDGSVFATGQSLSTTNANGTMKVLNGKGTSVFEAGADFLSWTRTGTVPEVSAVVFESSADSGATWTKIGDGVRVADGWRLDGITVPAGIFLRARGNTAVSSRGFSLCAQTKLVGRSLTPLESWRLAKFGSPLNESTGHDRCDADADGVRNLIEYGFGLDPLSAASRVLPSWSFADGGYQIGFTKAPAAAGVNHGAEWSTTLAAEDWHPAEDLSVGDGKSFRVPVTGQPQIFFRLKVIDQLGGQ